MAFKVSDIRNYNTDIKIAGGMVTVREYTSNQIYGYQIKSASSFTRQASEQEIEEAKKRRFQQSAKRAKSKVFDLVACNVNKHLDYNQRQQMTKFLTLTFKENKQDLTEANLEVTKYLKRLSYYYYGVKKNVIKYICVPELQKRGAWHYHIILFNAPYMAHYRLLELWGHGSVYINALKRNSDGVEVAKYVTKYISKGIGQEDQEQEDQEKSFDPNQSPEEQEERKGDKNLFDYENYKRYGLENKKRYQCSKGLIRPEETRVRASEMERQAINEILKEFGKEKIYIAKYENEHRGEIIIKKIQLSQEGLEVLKEFTEYIYRKNNQVQGKMIKPKWGMINNIIFNRLWKEGKKEDIKLKEIKEKINKALEGVTI